MHRLPGRAGKSGVTGEKIAAFNAIGTGQSYAGADIEHLPKQTLFQGGTVVPVIVVLLGGVIDEILRHIRKRKPRPSIDRAPLCAVGSGVVLARSNLVGSNHLNPWMVGYPAHVLIVGVRVGFDRKVLPLINKGNDLVLLAISRLPVKQLSQ